MAAAVAEGVVNLRVQGLEWSGFRAQYRSTRHPPLLMIIATSGRISAVICVIEPSWMVDWATPKVFTFDGYSLLTSNIS